MKEILALLYHWLNLEVAQYSGLPSEAGITRDCCTCTYYPHILAIDLFDRDRRNAMHK